jgi:hypothetical protein
MPTSATYTSAPLTPFHGIGQGRGNLGLPACVLALGFNKFRVQSERYHKNQVLIYKIHLQPSGYI